MSLSKILAWLFLLSPIWLGVLLAFARPKWGLEKVQMCRQKVVAAYDDRASGSFVKKYLERPLIWPFVKLDSLAKKVEEPYKQAGLWVLVSGLLILGLAVLALFGIGIVIGILLPFIVIWALIQGNRESSGGYESSASSRPGMQPGRSVERETLLGEKYTEHQDDRGNVIGQSYERKTLLGEEYTQHEDATGNTVGETHTESNFVEGLTGDSHVTHYDDKNNRIGTSYDEQTIIEELTGDSHTEHYAEDGEKIGVSREKKTILGDKYKEHSKK